MRSGDLSLTLVGTWEDAEGPTAQRLNSVRWPLTLRFPSWVQGEYEPVEMWETTIFDPVTMTGGAFVGFLELYEGEEDGSLFTTKRKVPRFELGTTVHGGHCLVDGELGLEMEFQQLFLSSEEDPLLALEGFNLTDVVTVSHSEGGCVYFSFPAEQTCDWCTLHSFSVVRQPVTRRLSQAVAKLRRRLDVRRLEHVQPEVLSQPSQQDGIAVDSVVGFTIPDVASSDEPTPDPFGQNPFGQNPDSDGSAESNSANHPAAASMWAASVTMSLAMIV